jgi:branched-chain amino acid transport system substrate-binding protein
MKYLAILAVAVLILSGCTGYAVREERIQVGFIAALTGPVADYGEPALKAAQLAVDEVNANGGIGGKQVQLIVEDGKCNSKEAATVAQKLIDANKVQVILGGHCSPETLGAASIAEQKQVVLFASISTSPDITNAGDYIFRNSASSIKFSEALAEYANENYDTLAIISETTSYAQPLADNLIKLYDGEVLAYELYNTEQNDFRTEIIKLIDSEPEAVFLSPQSQQKMDLLVKQLYELGYTGQILTNEVGASDIAIEYLGELTEGMIYATPPFEETDDSVKFREDFKAKYKTDKVAYEYFTMESYDATKLILEAIEQVGNDADKIKNYLYSVEDWHGASGITSIDENGDNLKSYSIHQIQKGKLALIQ